MYTQLTETQREVIALRLACGVSQAKIANEIGCHKSSISREVRRNSLSAGTYTVQSAQQRTNKRRQRPCKLNRDTKAAAFVRQRLGEGWSPEQIAGHLSRGVERIAYVCHEAIYNFIYAPSQSDEQLWKHLVRRRSNRKPRAARTPKSRIPNRTSIHQRPETIDKREDVGHWEADYVICKDHQPLLVMHERKTRITLVSKLSGRGAAETIAALTAKFKKLAKSLRATLTLDNDLGFAMHENLQTMLGMKTYFCDAYASWQKGGVERANGRLRYWIPKRADLSKYSDQDIEDITMKMNLLPMKCLGWKTPLQVWAEHANRNIRIKFA